MLNHLPQEQARTVTLTLQRPSKLQYGYKFDKRRSLSLQYLGPWHCTIAPGPEAVKLRLYGAGEPKLYRCRTSLIACL